MTNYAKYVGAKNYPWPRIYIDEVWLTGGSWNVPPDFPIVELGDTIVLIHEKAGIRVTTPGMILRDLAAELLSEIGQVTINLETFDPFALDLIDKETGFNMPYLVNLLQQADEQGTLSKLEEKYDISYYPAFFAWSPLTGKQWVAPKDATRLPDVLIGKGIEAVHDSYV